MKNVLILTAMFLSSAALADSTTVTQPVKATVENTCIVVVNSSDLASDIGERSVAGTGTPNSDIAPIKYKANTASNTVDTHSNGKAQSPDGGLYAFRCTSGTTFSAQVDGKEVTKNFAGKITLMSPDSAAPLVADFNITRIDIPDGATDVGSTGTQYGTFTGDVHAADAAFSVAAGQWSAKASANYTGKLVVNVTFN